MTFMLAIYSDIYTGQRHTEKKEQPHSLTATGVGGLPTQHPIR